MAREPWVLRTERDSAVTLTMQVETVSFTRRPPLFGLARRTRLSTIHTANSTRWLAAQGAYLSAPVVRPPGRPFAPSDCQGDRLHRPTAKLPEETRDSNP